MHSFLFVPFIKTVLFQLSLKKTLAFIKARPVIFAIVNVIGLVMFIKINVICLEYH